MVLIEELPVTEILESPSGLLTEISGELTGGELAIKAMDALAVDTETGRYYEAADPGYKSSFTRDSLIAMSLRGDPEILEGQISYSIGLLGKIQNPLTGEEPGKAHHELPSVGMNGLSSAYNACDTTAELLRSIAVLAERGRQNMANTFLDEVQLGIGYVVSHVNEDGLFVEDPKFSGATEGSGRDRKYALKVTYWKDSELNREGSREPHYPIVYSLAHFQNAEALIRIGRALGAQDVEQFGENMLAAGLHHLWADDHFVTAIDQDGVIDSPNSDSLNILRFLPADWLPAGYASKIENYMIRLETEAGYRAGIPSVAEVDPYHMKVWTHEQALLHHAARKHGLLRAEEITRRIVPFLMPRQQMFPELIDAETYKPGGNDRQLWAMGTYLYFQDPVRALM